MLSDRCIPYFVGHRRRPSLAQPYLEQYGKQKNTHISSKKHLDETIQMLFHFIGN